jgi:hypothetical protein
MSQVEKKSRSVRPRRCSCAGRENSVSPLHRLPHFVRASEKKEGAAEVLHQQLVSEPHGSGLWWPWRAVSPRQASWTWRRRTMTLCVRRARRPWGRGMAQQRGGCGGRGTAAGEQHSSPRRMSALNKENRRMSSGLKKTTFVTGDEEERRVSSRSSACIGEELDVCRRGARCVSLRSSVSGGCPR